MGTQILRHVARLDELGLRHHHHNQFMRLIKSYDFYKAFADRDMIRAWGAQLANQVYWLKNLGVADYRSDFRRAVKVTYPDHMDSELSKKQFENKIYTLTHIIIGASEYFRNKVDYSEYRDIIEYFKSNTHVILDRCKEDVIIEVGLSLLLVDENIPQIEEIRSHILSKVDVKKRMILSENGKSKFAQGEHRNIIAVLLLDWKGCAQMPTSTEVEKMGSLLSSSLKKMD